MSYNKSHEHVYAEVVCMQTKDLQKNKFWSEDGRHYLMQDNTTSLGKVIYFFNIDDIRKILEDTADRLCLSVN